MSLGGLFSGAPPASGGGNPSMVIEAIFSDAAATKRMQQYQRRIESLEGSHVKLANHVRTLEAQKTRAVRRGVGSRTNLFRKMRWEGVTLLFFTRLLAKGIQSAWNLISESAEAAATQGGARALAISYEINLGRVARALMEVSNGALSARDAIKVAQSGMLQDQGEFVDVYTELWQAARVAMVTAGADQEKVFEALVQSMVEGSGEAIDAATSIFQVRVALQEYASATGTTVEALDRHAAAQVILNTVMGTTENLLNNGADAALEQIDALHGVTAAWTDFKDVMAAIGGETGALAFVGRGIRTITMAAVLGAAAIAQMKHELGLLKTLELAITKPFLLPGYISQAARGEGGEKFNEVVERALVAMNKFDDAVSEGPFTGRRIQEREGLNIDPILDHILKRENLVEQHNHRLGQIELQRANRIEDIEANHTAKIARIERRAQRNREGAWRGYNRKILRETEDYYLDISQATDKYYLDRLHKQQEFRIKSIQDERLYQYERGLLVGYGDVLAIEDLDARYALENQAKAENFAQKSREDSDEFQLDLSHKREQYDLELVQLRRALDDQLTEIRIKLSDQLEEAAAARVEDLRRAERDYEQRLDLEQYNHNRSLEQWRQHWAKISEQTKVGADKITEILQEHFGPEGIADIIIKDFTDRFTQRMNIRTLITRIVGEEAVGGGKTEEVVRWSRFQNDPRRGRGYQFGGEAVISRPTMVLVGEGYRPERLSVTPMDRGLGTGSVALSWAGGAIPIEGRGSMEGVNTQAIGNAITQGLLMEMTQQLAGRRK